MLEGKGSYRRGRLLHGTAHGWLVDRAGESSLCLFHLSLFHRLHLETAWTLLLGLDGSGVAAKACALFLSIFEAWSLGSKHGRRVLGSE